VTSSEVNNNLIVSPFLTVISAGEKAKRFAWTSTVRVGSCAWQKLVRERKTNDTKTATIRQCFIILRVAPLPGAISAWRKDTSSQLKHKHI